MRRIKAIIKRPDEKYGHMTHVSDTLENLQRTVGGYIEVISPREDVIIICNEEGKLMGLPVNMKVDSDYLVGTIIVCGADGEEFADVPISFQEWKRMVDTWSFG